MPSSSLWGWMGRCVMLRAVRKEDAMDNQVEAAVGELRKDVGDLRKEIGGLEVRLVDRISQSEAGLRKDIGSLEVRLVDRMNQSETGLRTEIGNLEVRMERGFGTLRSDVIKWSFAFWTGQVVAMAAILSVLLR